MKKAIKYPSCYILETHKDHILGCGECATRFSLKMYAEYTELESLLAILVYIKNLIYASLNPNNVRNRDGTTIEVVLTCDGRILIVLPEECKGLKPILDKYLACEVTAAVNAWILGHDTVSELEKSSYNSILNALTTNVSLTPVIALAETILPKLQEVRLSLTTF